MKNCHPKIMTLTVRETIQQRGCCECGTYKCQVPMAIRGRRQDIDICVADIVAALNAAGIITVASCCGHGKMDGLVLLDDGRRIDIRGLPKEK
jgi:hypothetical protein